MTIGKHIREKIIPFGMTVSAAAKKVGVSRPAFSNLLNDNASLSSEMAARLERAFGANAIQLLALQSKLDTESLAETTDKLAVARQVPHLGKITATEISRWGLELDSRALFPALLRKLIAPLGDGIISIDFPAYDQSQKPGWDGQLETSKASPWVPLGQSVWEFGCNKSPQDKANADYKKRTKETPLKKRRTITYVFVTPHNWEGKDEWIETRKSKKEWKDVVALDAVNLENWVEYSLQAQSFLLECLDRKHEAISSLETIWSEWADICEPVFPHSLFKNSAASLASKLTPWLQNQPNSPFVVQANTTDEALACVASMFMSQDGVKGNLDRAIQIVDATGINTLRKTTTPMIVIIGNPDIEMKLADLPQHHHTIIARNKSLMHDDPDYAVDILNSFEFSDALREFGFDTAEIDRLSATSGGSLTVLRREWATIPQIKRPHWVTQIDAARVIASVALLGAWNAVNDADKFILSYFAKVDDYDQIEQDVAFLTEMEDTPLWRISQIRGVSSKVDALAATAHLVTDSIIERFFEVAYAVLAEDDPSLDLPEDERWLAGIHNKVRQHSPVLRRSIRETLTLLDMYSDTWFSHLTTNLRRRVQDLILNLLTPLTTRLLQAHDDDLMHYAEAAPETFLTLLEEDLSNETPQLVGLLKPTSPGPFSSPSRTGLLWALEIIAWNPVYYERVVFILARMSTVKIEDNWTNKPTNSLESLFRCWMPQTAALLDRRKDVLSKLTAEYPKIGWDVAMDQLRGGMRSGGYNARPKWRTDSHGAGEPVTYAESDEMALHALDLVLAQPDNSWEMLAELAENSQRWPQEQQAVVWKKVENWAALAGDMEKAKLKEKLRRHLHMDGLRKNSSTKICGESAWRAMDYLTPDSLVERHRWLFEGQWLPESMDEIHDERMDWRERDERTKQAREAAALELYEDGGLQALYEVTSDSDSPSIVTQSLVSTLNVEKIYELIPSIFREAPEGLESQYVYGLICDIRQDYAVKALVENVFAEISQYDKIDFLRCLPIGNATWSLKPFQNEEIQKDYWETINISWNRLDDDELNVALSELLKANRPIMAMNAASHEWVRVSSELIAQILYDVAYNHDQPDTDGKLQAHQIASALSELSTRDDFTDDQMIGLEYAYLKPLRFSQHAFTALKKSFASAPALFIESLIWAFKRRDDHPDEARFTEVTDKVRNSLAGRSYDLLDQVDILPGLHKEDELDNQRQACRSWVEQARKQAKAVSRLKVCDSKLGEFFSKSPDGTDGIWPHEVARDAIELVNNEQFREGFIIGVRNGRGVRTSSAYEGGDQERVLAEKYNNWAKEVSSLSSLTARILSEIADSYLREAKRNDEDAKLRTRLERK